MQISLGRLGTINLAKRSAPPTDTEVGAVGDGTVRSLFDGEVINTSEVKIKDLQAMRKNDGSAKALYNILTMPIKAADWDIKPKDDSAEAKKQAEKVKEWLTRPSYEGGMSTPFSLVISDALRAVLEGWRMFEKVHTVSQDGFIVYRKIARRENTSVTIKEDETGGFNGCVQNAYKNGKYMRVTIPREKCFLYTFGKEFDPLYGESAFLAAYYHYDKKHRLYYAAHQSVQNGAIPLKTVTSKPNATQDQLDSVVSAVDQLGFNSTVGIPDGYEVSPYEASKGRIDPQPLIDHHNAEMARSVLAQFIMLGTGSDTGSYALSSDQSDMFIMALEGIMNELAEHITSYIVAELHDFNFATPMYSKFEFSKLTDSTISLLKEISMKVFDKRPEAIPEYLLNELVEKLATQLGIDIPKDTTSKDSNVVQQSRGSKRFLAKGAQWRRDLTPAESKVNFSAISKKMDTLEAQFQKAVKPIFDDLRADTVKRIEKLLDAKDYAGIDSFTLNYGNDLAKVFNAQMLEAYTFAKVGAADELGVPAPATKNTSKQLIRQQAQAISDKQLSDLLFNIKNIISEARRKNQLNKKELSIGDTLAAIAMATNEFYGRKVVPTSAIVIAKGVNIGRDDVFQEVRSKVSKYQYSAILDEVTCPVCEDLDGSVVDEAEYRSTKWMPPIHNNCRCIWVAIMVDEEDQPDLTGFPDSPGGESNPSLDGIPTGAVKNQPFKNFVDNNLETIAQNDIKGRPNAEVNTQIEKLLKAGDPASLRDAIRLGVSLPKDDVAAMLDSITLPDSSTVGSYFYTVKLGPTGKIAKVLKDATLDPTKMTIEQIAKIVGLPTTGSGSLSRTPLLEKMAETAVGRVLDRMLGEAQDDERE